MSGSFAENFEKTKRGLYIPFAIVLSAIVIRKYVQSITKRMWIPRVVCCKNPKDTFELIPHYSPETISKILESIHHLEDSDPTVEEIATLLYISKDEYGGHFDSMVDSWKAMVASTVSEYDDDNMQTVWDSVKSDTVDSEDINEKIKAIEKLISVLKRNSPQQYKMIEETRVNKLIDTFLMAYDDEIEVDVHLGELTKRVMYEFSRNSTGRIFRLKGDRWFLSSPERFKAEFVEKLESRKPYWRSLQTIDKGRKDSVKIIDNLINLVENKVAIKSLDSLLRCTVPCKNKARVYSISRNGGNATLLKKFIHDSLYENNLRMIISDGTVKDTGSLDLSLYRRSGVEILFVNVIFDGEFSIKSIGRTSPITLSFKDCLWKSQNMSTHSIVIGENTRVVAQNCVMKHSNSDVYAIDILKGGRLSISMSAINHDGKAIRYFSRNSLRLDSSTQASSGEVIESVSIV